MNFPPQKKAIISFRLNVDKHVIENQAILGMLLLYFLTRNMLSENI